MLKDSFNRKPKKAAQPRQTEAPPGSPLVNPAQGLPSPDPMLPQSQLSDSQSLAAIALGRLAGGYAESQQASAPPTSDNSTFQPAGRFQKIEPCELTGTAINDLYLIKGQLGRGGMGQVLLCHHLKREVDVVMKLMLGEADPEERSFKRFVQECQAAHRIQHRNVVTVMDYGILTDRLQLYLVMEFVDGLSLRQLLRQRQTIGLHQIAEILMHICNGLNSVHCRGVIHRDLKPDNIMIEFDEKNAISNAKILDFGVAQLQKKNRVDDQGLAVGSVLYMSPEQACGQSVDLRTDIYSLGAILYECVTGAPPLRGKTHMQTMEMHVNKAVTPPSQIVSGPLIDVVDAICLRALAKSPAERYQSVVNMQMDIARLLP